MYKVIIVLLVCLFTAVFASTNFHHQLDPYNPEFKPGEILVKFTDEVELQISSNRGIIETGINSLDNLNSRWQVSEMEKIFKTSQKRTEPKFMKTPKGETVEVPQLFNIYKIKLPEEMNIEEAIAEFDEDPNVEFAEPNYYVYTMETYPDDPMYQSGEQWYIDTVNAPTAWDLTTCDTTQVIAVIDTGVDWDHPDLDSKIWTNWNEIPGNGVDDDDNGYIDDIRGWDYVNENNDPNDDNCHGTHVAGIAAAESNNGLGITGVAWNARIMPIKMLQSSGAGNSADLASAIDYAANNGATVINMSLGSYAQSLTVKSALENAYASAILVAAAGNDGLALIQEGSPAGNMYPACYSFVIGVEATDQANGLASFSNRDPSGPFEFWNEWGNNYEIKAPGVGIFSTFPNGSYHSLNGTSMASPIVAGAVALMKSYDPTQTTEQIFSKLIQGSNSGILNIENSLSIVLQPDLYFVEYTLLDTLPDCDNDGLADAGETIEIYLTVKNAGGFADNVWTKFRFGEFEDPSVANITDSTSYIGDMSAYATLTGELDHFIIEIDPDVIHNRDIVFEYEIGADNLASTITGQIIISVDHGFELSGIFSDELTLTPDKHWIITGSFRITPEGVLNILPGTELEIETNLVNDGNIIGIGTPDSMITISGTTIKGGEMYGNLHLEYANIILGSYDDYLIREQNGILEFCHLEFELGRFAFLLGSLYIKDCEFCNMNLTGALFAGNYNIFRCNFDNGTTLFYDEDITLSYNNMSRYIRLVHPYLTVRNPQFIEENNIFDSYKKICYYTKEGYYEEVPNQYWGTNDSLHIEEKIYDFMEDAELAKIVFSPFLDRPTPLAHGCVWKVEIDGVDPQDEFLEPLGAGTYQFDVYFSKPMDVTTDPTLTFGVREPYVQKLINNDSFWSADSTMWTAFYDIGLNTGDGINTIRVSGAYDTAGFVIPVEVGRFQFVIQAAGAQSLEFIATAGIGKVDLEWPFAETADVLGFNMYRFENLTDSTFTDTTLISTELIIDSTYTDFAVIPETTYRYLYKIVGTDMEESDFSKVVSATPFNATPGDANGDLVVNVLDITSIVNYLLNNNPEPFLFDGADANEDGNVNVLDIVAVVNIIMGDRGIPQYVVKRAEENPVILADATSIKLTNGSGIAAMQFNLTCSNLSENSRLIGGELLENMEYSYSVSNDTIYVILYNLNNRALSINDGTLFTLSEGQIKGINEVIASDIQGQQILVEFNPEENIVPMKFSVSKNYPNPFNPTTKIDYALPADSDVVLSIYNIKGQLVRKIKQKDQPAGYHHLYWHGKDNNKKSVASGVYLYRIEAGKHQQTKKMLLLK